MQIKRFIGHLFYSDWRARRIFSPAILKAIEMAIYEGEQLHGGEIRFAVEGGLDGARLIRGQSSRERAIEVFSQLRVWDTEDNNGVLIYVLLADKVVEIVADRGIHAMAKDTSWATICQRMQSYFSKSKFEEGAVNGIEAVAEVLRRHFPESQGVGNELPDAPILLS